MRDEGSLNGVFVRITGSVRIEAGSTVLVGEQVLSVIPPRASTTYPIRRYVLLRRAYVRVRSSRARPAASRRLERLGVPPRADTVSLGREGNDINFPDDPFISGRHAQLQLMTVC